MKVTNIFIIFFCFLFIVGCGFNDKDNKNSIDDNLDEVINSMNIIIDNKEYLVNLEDNETVKSLINYLPMDLKMNELNGNEKYVYLDFSLPTKSINLKHINIGDVMLFGDNCLVIFYKSFDTNYSYTKIGHIDNLSDLGNDSVEVRIEK